MLECHDIFHAGDKMKKLLLVTLLGITGCASNSGVVPMGSDTYFVSRQGATGFSGAASLKAESLQEANQFCLMQKKTMEVVNMTEAQPPFILGNYPKAEVQFKCVNK